MTNVGFNSFFDKQLDANKELAATRWLREVNVLGEEQNFISYAQLGQLVDIIADAVLKQHKSWNEEARNEQPLVAVCMPPSIERIAAILALWKLGVAFVPLDPKLPAERAAHMVRVASPMFVFSLGTGDEPQAELLNQMSKILEQSTVKALKLNEILLQSGVTFNKSGRVNLNKVPQFQFNETPIWNSSGTDSLATVMFTSGSTGVPKGVKLTHRNLLARLEWQWDAACPLAFQPDDIALLKTNALFIDSLTECFGAVGRLVNAVIVPPQLLADPQRFIAVAAQHKVTRLVAVPSPWNAIMQHAVAHNASIGSLRTLVLSGEQLQSPLARLTRRVCSGLEHFVNLYGSTETTGDVLYEVLDANAVDDESNGEENVPVGKPLGDTRAYILDAVGEPVPEGTEGDLYISGALIAKGYLESSSTPTTNAAEPVFTQNQFANDDEKQV